MQMLEEGTFATSYNVQKNHRHVVWGAYFVNLEMDTTTIVVFEDTLWFNCCQCTTIDITKYGKLCDGDRY